MSGASQPWSTNTDAMDWWLRPNQGRSLATWEWHSTTKTIFLENYWIKKKQNLCANIDLECWCQHYKWSPYSPTTFADPKCEQMTWWENGSPNCLRKYQQKYVMIEKKWVSSSAAESTNKLLFFPVYLHVHARHPRPHWVWRRPHPAAVVLHKDRKHTVSMPSHTCSV